MGMLNDDTHTGHQHGRTVRVVLLFNPDFARVFVHATNLTVHRQPPRKHGEPRIERDSIIARLLLY